MITHTDRPQTRRVLMVDDELAQETTTARAGGEIEKSRTTSWPSR